MNQRLVWNFEFSGTNLIPLPHLITDKEETIKWEKRFFWSQEQIIQLCNIDNALLNLANYQQKCKEDDYYLLANSHENIKQRHNELIYKPILQQTKTATGYGPKINLDQELRDSANNKKSVALAALAQEARQHGIQIFVKKEVFSYKFPSIPPIKLELARLEIKNQIYFSACMEGKSLFLVEYLSDHLLGRQNSCDYVTFLKKFINS